MPISVKSKTMPDTYRVSPNESFRVTARALIGRALGFKDCTEDVLDELVAIGYHRRLRRGEFLCRRGEPLTTVHMLVSGILESARLQSDGHRHLLGLLLPGDFLGLVGLVDGKHHTHDLCARADCEVLEIAAHQLIELRTAHVSVVHAVEQQIAYRYRMLFDRLSADPSIPLELRAAKMLMTMANLYGRTLPDGCVSIDINLSQADLADWLGLSRQRVNFALKKLEADQIISLRYSALTITDFQGLQRVANI
jgi:CRP/FNR family transcriptional regulator, cyclic AMP receptor protein